MCRFHGQDRIPPGPFNDVTAPAVKRLAPFRPTLHRRSARVARRQFAESPVKTMTRSSTVGQSASVARHVIRAEGSRAHRGLMTRPISLSSTPAEVGTDRYARRVVVKTAPRVAPSSGTSARLPRASRTRNSDQHAFLAEQRRAHSLDLAGIDLMRRRCLGVRLPGMKPRRYLDRGGAAVRRDDGRGARFDRPAVMSGQWRFNSRAPVGPPVQPRLINAGNGVP